MQIINVEIKTAANGNTYKQVSLAEKAYGKDRTNVFSNHPMYNTLEVGADVPVDMLEINQKGYLELKGGTVSRSKASTPSNDRETLSRLEKKLDAILWHVVEKAKSEKSGMPMYPSPEMEGIDVSRSGDVPDIKDDEIPF